MNGILVVGASGAVGSRVARALAPEFGRDVVLVGRREGPLRELAARLGTRWSAADLDDPAAVRRLARGVRVAVLTVEGPVAAARALLEAGAGFVDVGATPAHLARLTGLDATAREHGATGVLSVGLAPGASNLLAHEAAAAVGGAARVEITVLLGAAERHGPAAVRWTVDSLLDPAPGAPDETVHLPGPDGTVLVRRARGFPFADAPVVAAALGARTTSRLAFDSRPAGAALRALGLLRRTPWSGSGRVRSALARSLGRVHLGGDVFTVRADAWSASGEHAARAVTGHRQTRATAAVTAEVARSLVHGEAPAGVVHLPALPVAAGLLTRLDAAGTWQHLRLGAAGGL
ncbi:saccharopine dehydrogenase [Kineococcus sp. SYSU DK001]|uniref:saccharopine dehydrogenase n=1 Tax=Kineococcus sp. SYSU DK001 TaxID=3383122 RepID=UPI003D7E1BAF